MRLTYMNMSRPKRAAKAISKTSKQPLALCQKALAHAIGYRDWRDLERSTARQTVATPFNEKEAHDVTISIVASLSEKLLVHSGALLNIIIEYGLIPSIHFDVSTALNIRCSLFERFELPPAGRRQQGAIGKLKSPGRNGETVILRKFGSPARVITHKSANSIVADFEYITPKQPLRMFIPMRLYVPYGEWTEVDGARVLFSRDYKPMWRLREGSAPERVEPWLWIKFIKQNWFWNDGNPPWDVQETYNREMERLNNESIRGTPHLVEALPVVVKQPGVNSFKNAVSVMKEEASSIAA